MLKLLIYNVVSFGDPSFFLNKTSIIMFNIIFSFTSIVEAEIVCSNIWDLSPKVYVRNLLSNITGCRLGVF